MASHLYTAKSLTFAVSLIACSCSSGGSGATGGQLDLGTRMATKIHDKLVLP